MKNRDLKELGIPPGSAMKTASEIVKRAAKEGFKKNEIREAVRDLVKNPDIFVDHDIFAPLAAAVKKSQTARAEYVERKQPAAYRQFGHDLELTALQQMENAVRLPISVKGALMPDAHQGYGLPIGGVLAADNAVIPYAVGMDIACRMKMTVLDIPVSALTKQRDRLIQAIEEETRFGVGSEFKQRRQHPVMDEDWRVSPVTARFKDKAWAQLGTSGSGNHFVEFGLLTLGNDDLGLTADTYLALLSHSGSRGTGGEVATHYSKLAMARHPELPRNLIHLAWFDLDSGEGREYWEAMHLMGRYAAASHELIHRYIAAHLGAGVLLDIENHHNFAWKEVHDSRDVIVHRKGATPAGKGDIGIIPGSMATPGFVMRGLGNPDSLNSAAHGAGRRMSRKAAKDRFNWRELKYLLDQRGVTLLSAGLDEVPMAYKDIETVMAAQSELVQIVARFNPKIVKMSPAGERPED